MAKSCRIGVIHGRDKMIKMFKKIFKSEVAEKSIFPTMNEFQNAMKLLKNYFPDTSIHVSLETWDLFIDTERLPTDFSVHISWVDGEAHDVEFPSWDKAMDWIVNHNCFYIQ